MIGRDGVEVIVWRDGLGRVVDIYRDHDDWWVGYYRGDRYHYVCPVPTLVIRWGRR